MGYSNEEILTVEFTFNRGEFDGVIINNDTISFNYKLDIDESLYDKNTTKKAINACIEELFKTYDVYNISNISLTKANIIKTIN